MNHSEIVFGPISSRRLGRSLGIDLLMGKICCQDCIYCEVGRTETLTSLRKEYIPAEKVTAALDKVLQTAPALDFITFSGLGEPTLSTAIGPVIRFIKKNYPQYKVCVLTNGMLLGDPAVRQDIAEADLVIPSLDASNGDEFLKINRPVADISFAQFIAGLKAFTMSFPGEIWLELFIVPGINDSDRSIERFAGIIGNLKVTLIQLNSLDRPGTEEDVSVSSGENAVRFAEVLSFFAETEILGSALRSQQQAKKLIFPLKKMKNT